MNSQTQRRHLKTLNFIHSTKTKKKFLIKLSLFSKQSMTSLLFTKKITNYSFDLKNQIKMTLVTVSVTDVLLIFKISMMNFKLFTLNLCHLVDKEVISFYLLVGFSFH